MLNVRDDIPDDNSTSIVITGDWSPGSGEFSASLKQQGSAYFGDIMEDFRESQLCVTNIETVLSDHDPLLKKSARKIVTEPDLAKLLNDLNIGLACLANNHIMDGGPSGLGDTIDCLNKIGIPTIGAGFMPEDVYKPFLHELNGSRVALFNVAEGEEACEKYNDGVGAAYIESFHFLKQLKKYKDLGFYIIVICHAGVEFLPTPAPYIKELFCSLLDEGADLIVGHHPHVPQGFEIYKDKPIFYSLGNFAMWNENRRHYEYESYMIKLKISVDQLLSIEFVPYKIDRTKLKKLPLDKFEKLLGELNDLLKNRAQMIWEGYLYRNSIEARYLKQLALWPFNSKHLRHSQVNYHMSLNQKYIHLESFSTNLGISDEVGAILDCWGISTKNLLLAKCMRFLENRFSIFLSCLVKGKSLLRYMRNSIFRIGKSS